MVACSQCLTELPRDSFSGAQLKKGASRKCKACVITSGDGLPSSADVPRNSHAHAEYDTFEEKEFVMNLKKQCAVCLVESGSLFKCDRCRGPRLYCSKACFKRDWKEFGHKDVCVPADDAAADAGEPLAALEERATSLKDAGNAKLQAKDYEGALADYGACQSLAMDARKRAARSRRAARKIFGDDPQETRLHRLEAISATNTAVTYMRMVTQPTTAHQADPNAKVKAKLRHCSAAHSHLFQALGHDPTYATKVLPRLQELVTVLGGARGDAEMAAFSRAFGDKMHLVETSAPVMGLPAALFNANLITYDQFAPRMVLRMRDELQVAKDEGRLERPPKRSNGGEWAVVSIAASLVPMSQRRGQWLSMSIRSLMGEPAGLECMHLECADPDGNPDAIDTVHEERWGAGGAARHSTARGGSPEACAFVRCALPKFVAEAEACGVHVVRITLGQGLFGINPGSREGRGAISRPPSDLEPLDWKKFPAHLSTIMPSPELVQREMMTQMAGMRGLGRGGGAPMMGGGGGMPPMPPGMPGCPQQ